MVELEDLADYIYKYIREYRVAYESATKIPPYGSGYPSIEVSPYLNSKEFNVYLSNNGVVIEEVSKKIKDFYIKGAASVEVNCSKRKNSKISSLAPTNGVHKVYSDKYIPSPIWKSEISYAENINKIDGSLNINLNLFRVENTLENLVASLTFGAFTYALNYDLPSNTSSFNEVCIIEKLVFYNADKRNSRYLKYTEIYGSSDEAAWDERIIFLKVLHDLRRDFVRKFSDSSDYGGSIYRGRTDLMLEDFTNKLYRIKHALDDFKHILTYQSNEDERVFHELIEKHPILLDVYGKSESKPKLKYPTEESSPIGKKYLEPDFIIKYSNQSYKLVELERASKNVVTRQGQPRAEVGQAVFQISEWIHYIKEHYNLIKSRYPSIHTNYSTCVIMSRSTQKSFKNLDDEYRYKELIVNQYNIDEFLTYDDLYDKALGLYTILSGLALNY